MIQDAWPQRPIYFARTSGGYARSLGLGDYVLTQGLASKLFMPPRHATAAKDTVYVQGDGWLDLPRSDSLWNNVFKGPQSVINTGDWIDRPSVGIPYLYVATGMELAEALKTRGDCREAQQVFDQAEAGREGRSARRPRARRGSGVHGSRLATRLAARCSRTRRPTRRRAKADEPPPTAPKKKQ